jgi:hypothetical protein
MSTPTLSMRIFGEHLRREVMHEMRSAAAKKAWQTRRRRAKPSPMMLKVLEAMATGKQLYTHGTERLGIVGISLSPVTWHPWRFRITRTTLKALLARKWIEKTEEYDRGDTSTIGPDGEWIVVDHSWDRYFTITDKGRQAIPQTST